VFALSTDQAVTWAAWTLSQKPPADKVWGPSWYKNSYQFDGYISYVPLDGMTPLYSIYDGNSMGPLSQGDYLTSVIEPEITQASMLQAGTAATANVPNVGVAKALIDGQTINMLQWAAPAAGARVKVTVSPALPGGATTPYIFSQGDGRSQFANGAALQGFSLETLPPGGTYQVKIEIQHPGNTWTKPYIARTDVSITVPASGGSAVVSQSEKITPVTPQIRAFNAPAINLSNRAVINREYDRWGNLTLVHYPRTLPEGTPFSAANTTP
jgi:hypothetical protein